jgi:hypothetical protein
MTNQHKATPDDWAQQEDWANRSVFSDSSCIIELRDRIEALEVGQQPLVNHAPAKPEYRDKLDRLIEQDRSNPQQLALVDRLATDAELCQVYNEKTTLRAVYDLGREHGAAPIRSGPESPLVERVADAIAAQATSAGIVNDRPARAAILEVAAWLRSEQARVAGNNSAFASLLEQKVNR